jgi:aryl-alcohol dehydrogenase-like predicted oxidoreductase
MEYTTLGRTGLKVSVAGLGCGGPSRLGLRHNADSQARAIALVRQAIELGVNFLDTAEAYGTEVVVGKAMASYAREQMVISTKKTLPPADHPDPETEVHCGLEQSLKRLATDYVDVYHLHGLEPKDYVFAAERLMPVMEKLRAQGKIRFMGVSEGFVPDPSHQMLQRSLKEDRWDVVMVGFNMLNPSARRTVLPLTRKNHVGVLNMFAVRRALSQPERLKGLCHELMHRGWVPPNEFNPDDPLDFILKEGAASSLPEAAYRFCRHESGIDVVLTGTGNPDHLKSNIEAILKPALDKSALDRLDGLFGKLDTLTGN